MSKIFINYRRKDSAPYAGRLYDRLAGRFGDDLCLWISPMRTGSGVWIIRMIGFGLKLPYYWSGTFVLFQYWSVVPLTKCQALEVTDHRFHTDVDTAAI